jgi:membrane protease YdiL (CAAX protease family)
VDVPQPAEPPDGSHVYPDGLVTPRQDHRWGFGAFFLAEGVFILVSVVLSAIYALDRTSDRSGVALLLALVLPTGLAAAVAVVISVVRGNGPRLDFGLQWRWSDVTTGFRIGAIGLISTTIASVLWTEWVGTGKADSAISSLLGDVRFPPAVAVLIFLYVWLLAPLCEELLYRGLLWGAMERLRWSRFTVFALTTSAFAIGHLEPDRTLLLLVIAVPIGLSRMYTGRITASVVTHQMSNFLPALGLLLMSLGALPK